MASRLPRICQRVIYKHRRSISLVYAGAQELQKKLTKTSCFQSPVGSGSRSPNVSLNPKWKPKSQGFAYSKRKMSTLTKLNAHEDIVPQLDQVHIKFQTFNDPKINLNVFQENLKQFWNFIPKRKHELCQNHIATIEFEHESKNPHYPLIIVSQLHHEKLSEPNRNIINHLIDKVELDSANDEDFLVSGRIWDSLTIAQFDSIHAESKFAASLAVSGIFPKPVYAANNLEDVGSVQTIALYDGIKAVRVSFDVSDADSQYRIPDFWTQSTTTGTFREILATQGSNESFQAQKF